MVQDNQARVLEELQIVQTDQKVALVRVVGQRQQLLRNQVEGPGVLKNKNSFLTGSPNSSVACRLLTIARKQRV